MIQSFSKILSGAALSLLLINSQAFALFDLQALVGSKTAKFGGDVVSEKDEVSAQSMQAAAYVNPIPLPIVTLGFGLGFAYDSYDINDNVAATASSGAVTGAAVFDSLSGFSVGPEVFVGASLPLMDLMPYVKAGYYVSLIGGDADFSLISGAQTVDQTGKKFGLMGAGIHYAVGLSYSPLPLLSVLVEMSFGDDSLTFPETETEQSGVKLTFPEIEGSNKSSTISLGVNFGI